MSQKYSGSWGYRSGLGRPGYCPQELLEGKQMLDKKINKLIQAVVSCETSLVLME